MLCFAGSQVTDEDLRVAEEKFDESKQLAETAMSNLLENDVSRTKKKIFIGMIRYKSWGVLTWSKSHMNY